MLQVMLCPIRSSRGSGSKKQNKQTNKLEQTNKRQQTHKLFKQNKQTQQTNHQQTNDKDDLEAEAEATEKAETNAFQIVCCSSSPAAGSTLLQSASGAYWPIATSHRCCCCTKVVPRVYLKPRGTSKKYHTKWNCRYIVNSDAKHVSLTEALARGISLCCDCKATHQTPNNNNSLKTWCQPAFYRACCRLLRRCRMSRRSGVATSRGPPSVLQSAVDFSDCMLVS